MVVKYTNARFISEETSSFESVKNRLMLHFSQRKVCLLSDLLCIIHLSAY